MAHLEKTAFNWKAYLVPVLLILLTFAAANFFLVRAIERHFYAMLQTQSLEYAQNYAHNMSKAAEAVDVINSLLDDKLRTASQTLALRDRELDSVSLSKIAEALELDEISFYDSNGVIIDTTQKSYLNWTANPGHPVFQFMTSGQTLHIEDVRADTETGRLVKYAYVRTNEGFYQLGLQAQRMEEFLETFESENILQEMVKLGTVDTICYLDRNLIVQNSSNPDLIGKQITKGLIKKGNFIRLSIH